MLYLLIWYISLDKHFQVQIKCLGIDCPRNGISSALCCMFFFSCNVCPWPLFCWHWTIPQSTTSALIWRGLNCRFCVVESGAKSRYDSVGQLGLSLGVNDFNFRWSEPYHSTSWTLRFYRWNLIFLEGETFRWIFHKTFTPGFFLALALIFTISLVLLVSLILELLEVNNSCWFKVDDRINDILQTKTIYLFNPAYWRANTSSQKRMWPRRIGQSSHSGAQTQKWRREGCPTD